MTGGNNLIKADVKIFPWRSFLSQHQKKLIPDNFLGKILFKLLIFLKTNLIIFFQKIFNIELLF